jgi:reactive intermediate/imine deaminase
MAGNTIEPVQTVNAAPPGGHYAQAVRYQDTLYISGQLPVRADGSHSADEPFETQALVALNNLLAILKDAGGDIADLVKVTVYVVGVKHWPSFNVLYAEKLGSHRPARAVVPVPELHHGYMVEIEAIARLC